MKLTKTQFKHALSQMLQMAKDDGTFQSHQMKQGLEGLTTSWTCRFDSATLFEQTGLTTGKKLFFLSTCNN